MSSRPSGRRATRWDCQILSNRVCGMLVSSRTACGSRNLPRGAFDCYASRMGKALLGDGDVISGAVLSALGLYIFLQAHQWDYSGPDGPGPGFFPTWYGLGMIALSLVMIGQRVRKGTTAAGAIDWIAAARGFGTWAAFTLSVALYKPLGFAISFALLTCFVVAVI